MAGIGFELRRLLQKESLGAKIQAFAFSAIIGSGPWILSIIAILVIGMFNTGRESPSANVGQFQISITYLMAFSLILSSLLQLVFTRFVADRLFEKRDMAILGNVMGALLLTFVVSGITGILVAALWLEGSLLYRLCMVVGFVLLCGVWIAVIFASAVKAYRRILMVFLIGYGVTVGAAYGLRGFGLEGLLGGFVIGQATLLFTLLALVVREYPGEQLVSFEFLRREQIYLSLVWTGLFYNLGVWVDKFIFWANPVTGVNVLGPLRAAPAYDLSMFLSYLSLIPGMAVFLIRMETDFSEKCEHFYTTIKSGGTLAQIHEARNELVASLYGGMLMVMKVQGATTLVLFVASRDILAWLGISLVDPAMFNVQLVGVGMQLLFLSVLNVFYYLDQRQAAFIVCLVFMLVNGLLSWLTLYLGPAFYGYGFAVAVVVTCVVGVGILVHKLDTLEYETFMLQPANV
ncbi:MAG: exopolysaccharide Pel transporter PelG [Polaromonas sp.]|nr:exopolysaccharide Pel transporter PelG [Polaromonas sp.]